MTKHSTSVVWVRIGIVVSIFLLLHIPGLHLPYHQDEYKWPTTVSATVLSAGSIPHPPLSLLIYRAGSALFGSLNLRFVPFLFGLADVVLLFYVLDISFGRRTAAWGIVLFTVSFYELLASLMVDIDGAIMPFFFLLMLMCYVKFLALGNGNNQPENKSKSKSKSKTWWAIGIAVCAVLGCLVKVSFIIGIVALLADYILRKNVFSSGEKVLKHAAYIGAGAVTLVVVFLASTVVFPFFHLAWDLAYWMHFVKFSGRGWGQTFIQTAKSLLYLSPLLVLPTFLVDGETFAKTRPFFFFIGFGLFFYLIAFDFSTGTLDKYLQFLIVPLCIISAVVYEKAFSAKAGVSAVAQASTSDKKNLILATMISVAVSIAIFLTQFLPQTVPALYPKSAWLDKVLTVHWNFLFPFTGGSGPTGFYVSFLFIALVWIVSLVCVGTMLFSRKSQKILLCALIVFGLVYNAVFIEEYIWGKINGSPYPLLTHVEQFIANDSAIQSVVVYNDIGGYDFQVMGKYNRRLYAAPQFENTYQDFFNTFSGYIVYIDIPRVDPSGFYGQYFATCAPIYAETDHQITAQVLQCPNPARPQ